MYCHECAIRGHERPAVALCRSCLVALCHEHLAESVQSAPVAPAFGCHHAPGATAPQIPSPLVVPLHTLHQGAPDDGSRRQARP